MPTMQSKLVSRTIWLEKKKIWKINIQKNGIRKSFYSSTPGDKGRKICAQNAASWLSGSCPFAVSDHTTVETVFERYLKDKELETTNIYTIRNRYNNHIKPIIGKIPVMLLTKQDLKRVIYTAYRKCDLSQKSLKNIRGDLSGFCNYLDLSDIRNDLRTNNIRIPSTAKKGKKQALDVVSLDILFSESQAPYNGTVCQDSLIYAYRFNVVTGMRTGELMGLEWGDIDDTGDYDAADIARVMSGTAAGIAEAYTKNARGQTIIFAPSIEEGKNVTALLNSQHGASTAAFIDGTTQNRGHFLEAYRLGLIKVLVCYAVLTEGVDLPMTETVVLARPIARTNVGLYAQMVGRGLRLYPGKASCKVIDCVGVSNMPICTAATLIGKDVPAPKPEKEPTEKLPEEQDPIKVLEGNEIPDSWIKNQKEVNVMALGEGYTTHDVAWLDVKGGGRILPLPNVVYRISKPLPNGMVYLRKNKKCSRCAVPLQFVLDYVYQDLKQNHPQQQHIWDKKQRYKWDRQPITSEQISLIHKLAPDYKIDTKKMTRGDASRVIQLLAYAPKEQDAQEQAQEVQDDAT